MPRRKTPEPVAAAPEPLLLTPAQAAELLGVSRTTIYRLVNERYLEAVKPGHRTLRISAASVEALATRWADEFGR